MPVPYPAVTPPTTRSPDTEEAEMGVFRKIGEFAMGFGYGVTNPVGAVKLFFEPETCDLRGCGERAVGHTTCCRHNLCAGHLAAFERHCDRCGCCPIPGCGARA